MADIASDPTQMARHWQNQHTRLQSELEQKNRELEALRREVEALRKVRPPKIVA